MQGPARKAPEAQSWGTRKRVQKREFGWHCKVPNKCPWDPTNIIVREKGRKFCIEQTCRMYSNSLPCIGTAYALTCEHRQGSNWQRPCVKTGKSSLTVQSQTFIATGPGFMSTLQYSVFFTVRGLDSLWWGWQAMSAVSLSGSRGQINHKKHLEKDSFEKYPAKCITSSAPKPQGQHCPAQSPNLKDSMVRILSVSVQYRGT